MRTRIVVALAAAVLAAVALAACNEAKRAAPPAATAPAATTEGAATQPAGSTGAGTAPAPAEAPDPRAVEADAWKQARAGNTIASFKAYLASYPDGRFAGKAKSRVRALRGDDRPYLAAQRRGTLEAYQAFLKRFPGHRREDEARAALKEIRADTRGRDVSRLLAEGKVAVRVHGSDITSVTVELKRLTKYPLRAVIPAGTYFSAGGSYVQDMVALQGESVQLDGRRWTTVYLDAACADIHSAIPGRKDTFTVGEASAALRRLARRLRSEDDTAVRQAAVWIVSDNANFYDLGTLIYTTGARAIGPVEAAAAMKLVDEAGIDITTKSIWYDRNGILSGLEKGPLKAWLKQR